MWSVAMPSFAQSSRLKLDSEVFQGPHRETSRVSALEVGIQGP